MDKITRIGEENIGRLLLNFSIPVIVSMFVSAAYNVVDRIFIGNSVGTIGIAAVTIGFPVMMIQSALGMMVGIGANSLLSIKLGEQNQKEAQQIVGNTIILLGIISVTVTMTVFFLDPLLILFGASKEVLPYARDYMRIMVLGTIVFDFGMGLNNFIRAEGKPNLAMAMLITGTLFNMIFTPIFIFILKMGITGAALGTVLAQAISAIWVMLYFITGKSTVQISGKCFRLKKQLVGRILVLGLPMFSMAVAESIITVIINKSLLYYGGDLAISVLGVFVSLFVLIFMPIIGLSSGAQPIIGFNYGAGKFERIKQTLKYANIAALIIGTLGFLLLYIFPAQLLSFFNSKDEEFIILGIRAIRIVSIFLPLIGFQILCTGYFQAVGKPVQANILSLSRQVLLFIPALLILPRFFQLDGVFLAMPVTDVLSVMVAAIWFFWDIHVESRKTPEERLATMKKSPSPRFGFGDQEGGIPGLDRDGPEGVPEPEPES